jgi:cytochrome c peroxidase
LAAAHREAAPRSALDAQLRQVLTDQGFTGTVGQSLEQRLGRPIDPALADLGRLLWFDKIGALHSDNSCGGCHSPSTASATRNRSRSASRTTTSSAAAAADRGTSAARRA